MNVGSVDVGTVSSALPVSITNTGGVAAPITVTAAPAGLVAATGCGANLPAGQSCVLQVTATPTAVGAFQGSVTVAATGGNTVVIVVQGTGTAPGNFTVSPTAIDLGSLAVGEIVQTTVTVTANTNLTGLSTRASGPDVRIEATTSTCGAALNANQSCTVAVRFTAGAAGASTGNAVVVSQGGVTKTVPITATVLAAAKLAATPATAALTARVGETSAPQTINIGNIGGMATGQLAVAIAPASFKVVSETCSIVTLAAGATCSVVITYSPAATATAPETGTLTVTDRGVGASVATVALQGVPGTSSTLTLTGGPGLGSVAPGAVGDEVVFTVTNISTTASGPLTAAVNPPANITISSNTCVTKTTLLQAETCTIGLRLTPAAGAAPAAIAAVLTVTAANGSVSANVTGAIVRGATLVANPTSVSFGSVFVNQLSAIRTVTITNTGATATGALSVNLTGPGAAQVALPGNTCTAALAAGQSCTLSVQYAPTDTTGVSGTIGVTDGVVSASIPMTGTGLAPANFVVCEGAASPAQAPCPVGAPASSVAFGSAPVGYPTATQTLTVVLSATATTDSGAITVGITGADAADFKYENNTCTQPLVPGASCTLDVIFTPSAAGARAAVLTVTGAKGGSWPVQLSGTGLALVSIYACVGTGDERCATLSEKAEDLSFGAVSLGLAESQYPDPRTFRVVVRGPIAAAAPYPSTTMTVALTDAAVPSNFRYPGTQTNPCTAKVVQPSSGGTQAAPWAYDGAAAIQGAYCDFQVQFVPQGTTKGALSATLSASGSAGGSDSKTITGEATGPLTITAAEGAGFPEGIIVGSSTNNTLINDARPNLTLTVTNNSTLLTLGPVAIALGGTDAGQFEIVEDACSFKTLAKYNEAGYSCLLIVAFSPTSAGAKSATVTATAGGETSNVFALTGNGAQGYPITLTPNGYSVPAAQAGTVTPVPYEFNATTGVVEETATEWVAFTVTNTAPAGSAKSSEVVWNLSQGTTVHFEADGRPGTSGACGASGSTQLAGGASCSIWVRFKALKTDAVNSPIDDGVLAVTVNSQELAVQLKGKPISRIALVQTSPAPGTTSPAGDFSDVASGATKLITFTVTNLGGTDLTLVAPAIVYYDEAGEVDEEPARTPFAIFGTGTTCGSGAIAPNGTCTIVVQMTGEIGETPLATPAADLRVSESGGASAASQALKGRTIAPATLVLVGMADQGALATSADGFGAFAGDVVDLGSIKSGSETGRVTLWFRNTGDIPATNLNFAWQYVDDAGALRNQTGYAPAGFAVDQPFVIPASETNVCPVGAGASLAPKTSCRIIVYANPSSTLSTLGQKKARFRLLADGPLTATSPMIQTEVQGANTSFFTVVTPAQNAFLSFTQVGAGKTPLGGTSDTVTFQLNAGSSGSAIDLVLGDDDNFALVSNNCTAALGPGGTCTFGVQFKPTGEFSSTDVYRFTTVTVGTVVLGLGGQVQSPAELALTPTGTVAFGEVALNTTVQKTFTVTNSGETASGAVTAAVASTTHFTVPASVCATVPAGGTCTFTVTVRPANLGAIGTTLTVTSASATVGTRSLTATGVTTGSTLTLSAEPASDTSTYTFATAQAVGTSSALNATPTVATITVTNVSNAQTTSALTFTTTGDAADFKINTDDCLAVPATDPPTMKTLAGGETCLVTVAFTPTKLPATGTTLAAVLRVSATTGGSDTYNLVGTPKPTIYYSLAAQGAAITTVDTHLVQTVYVSLDPQITSQSVVLATGMLSTSLTGADVASFIIRENGCVDSQLFRYNTGVPNLSCAMVIEYIGGTTTTVKQTTLRVGDGTAGNTANLAVTYDPASTD